MGHDYLVEYWDEFTPEELDEALGAALMTLTFFLCQPGQGLP